MSKTSRLNKYKKKIVFAGEAKLNVTNTSSKNTFSKANNLADQEIIDGERKLNLMRVTDPYNICDPVLDPSCIGVNSGFGGGGGSSSPTPAPAPATSPTTTSTAPSTCTGQADLTEVGNAVVGSNYQQSFKVGANVWAGWQYQIGVYSVVVQIVAQAGDTPSSIAQRLATAVNNTALATWMQSGSDNHSFKPSATASGDTVTTTCDGQHSFFGSANGSCAVAPPPVYVPPPPSAPPPPVTDQTPPVVGVAPINDITLPNNAVSLDGLASYSPSGHQLTYEWRKVSGGQASADSVNAPETTLHTLDVGAYTIRLIVTDTVNNQSAFKDVSFSVNAAPVSHIAPTIVIQPINDINLPTTNVLLDGSGSSSSDGSPLTFQWTKSNGGNAQTDDATKAVTELRNLQLGNYTLRLTAIDANGNSAYKEVSFSVNAQPVVTTTPDQGYGYTSPMGGMMGGAGGSSDSAALPAEAAAPQRNWIWGVLAAMIVGFAVFSKEGGKAATE